MVGLLGDTPKISRFFLALALAESYVAMIKLMVERASTHPEVTRVPGMLDVLLEHFQTYPLDHINVDKQQIFNKRFVGTIQHLEAWQQAGYPLERGDADYDERVEIWRAIWKGVEVERKVSRTYKNGKRREYTWTFKPKSRYGSHEDADYETIINTRNENYSEIVRYIPFWLPLNEGTGSVGSNPGYPAVAGLHFVDIAEQGISKNVSRYIDLFSEFMAEQLMEIEPTNNIAAAKAWIKSRSSYTETFDIDTFAIAERLASA